EGLEQSDFADGVALGSGELAVVLALPGTDGVRGDQHLGGVPALAIGADGEDEFRAGIGAVVGALSFKIILVDVAALGGIGLASADRGSPGERLRFPGEKALKHFIWPKRKNTRISRADY